MPFIGNLQQEMNTCLLLAQDGYVSQCLIPWQLVNLTPEIFVQLHEVFQEDLLGDQRQLHNVRQDGRR